ncbi:DUF1279 superfamily [Lithohypha guttulata]|uniref:DUF1279 superfamily n=1 Tax=Lithohypha guttulata TaxID=1690604 RepID=UPI002DDDD8F9|nr:DUF1279 superfamily [Lithohypha guttulata]
MDVLRIGLRASRLQLPRLQQRSTTSLLHSYTQPTFRTRPIATWQTTSRHAQNTKNIQSTRFCAKRNPSRTTRRWKSEDASLDSKPDSQLSLGQRLKKLSREYGWAAVYIYLGLSLLDFPFCFLAVKTLGTDTIGHWEHVIVSYVKGFLQWPVSGTVQEQIGDAVDKIVESTGLEEGRRILEEDTRSTGIGDHGYKEAEQANGGNNASLWTQLVLAYAIHKSFIFVRVPLTAAVTPKIVKTLRGWGWNIGRPSRKALQTSTGSGKTGVNTKGSGTKSGD